MDDKQYTKPSPFAKRLRAFIKEEGLSDKAFMTKMNRTKGVGYYEKNPNTLPKTSFVLGIMEHFPTWSIDYLITGNGAPYITDTAPKREEPEPIGHFGKLIQWMGLLEDTREGLRDLPPDAYKPMLENLTTKVVQIEEENRALLRYIVNHHPETTTED